MRKFVLRKLIVKEACGNKLKILEPGEYTFSNAKYDSFFMDGIAIQAIVGKNGCGKSSLVELLFRMANNLAALMLKEHNRPACDPIFFISDVVAELHYDIDAKHGVLKCLSDRVELSLDNERFVWSVYNENCIHYKNEIKVNGEYPFDTAMKAAKTFFYTIATNYSVQSYIASDFMSEALLEYKEDENDSNKKKWLMSGLDNTWINSVFHKNDGYMCPIVLNPYRSNGKLDMEAEERLTTNRLCAILWETRLDDSQSQFIDGYRFYNLLYTFKISILINKFTPEVLKEIGEPSFTGKFIKVYNQPGSFAKVILKAYGYGVSSKMNTIELCLRIYLVYKTFRIAKKYPSYEHFNWIGDVDYTFKNTNEHHLLELATNLVQKINKDESHITIKIRQTKTIIEKISKISNKDKKNFELPIPYERYCQLLEIPLSMTSIEERLAFLPPPFMKPDIFIVKTEDYDVNFRANESHLAKCKRLVDKAIHINQLSSGERQFIFMTTTLVYHTLNLKSVPEKERISYKNICMVLDEIEICFHPEYQRTFINKLITLLKRTGLADYFGVNVLIVTHSPFVLSDIPQGNIMYLKQGHQLTEDELKADGIGNPFCANINDILHQSFFLEKGFIGEFARQKVLSLMKYLQKDVNDDKWTSEKAKNFIDEIGEPLIRTQLLEIYKESPVAGLQDKIALYQAEIARLQHTKE